MHKKYLGEIIFSSFLIVLAFLIVPIVSAKLVCNVSDTCLHTDIFHLSNTTNAHAELPNQTAYSYYVCCNDTVGVELSNFSSTSSFTVLHLSNMTNAHVEQNNESYYQHNVYIDAINGTLNCSYEGDCDNYDACLASISTSITGKYTDLHVADCTTDPYATKICCSVKLEFLENVSESMALTGITGRIGDFFRLKLDTFSLTKLLLKIAGFPMSVLELMNIDYFISRLSIFGRAILQNLNISDFILRLTNWYRSILETLNIADFIYKLPNFIKMITQSLNISDFILRLTNWYRSILESFNINDLLYKFKEVALKAITETLNITDFISRLSIFGRAILQNLNINDFILRLTNWYRSILETFNISDFISRLAIFGRSITQALNINDFITRLSSFYRSFLERFNIFDFLSLLRRLFVFPPTGAGGGGVTAAAAAVRKTFDVKPGEIKTKLKVGESTIEELKIKNTGELSLSFALETGLELVYISQDKFSLNPNEKERVILAITAPNEPGIYTGNILIKADGLSQKIPVIIEVETKMILFDVKLDLPWIYKKIYPGENLKAQISLFEMGKNPKVDVILNYLIKDLNNNILNEQSETIAVENQLSFTKIFYTEDLPIGTYVVAIEARYSNSFAVSSDTFKIVERKLPIPISGKIFTILLAIVTALIIIHFLLKIKEIETKKTTKKPRKKQKSRIFWNLKLLKGGKK